VISDIRDGSPGWPENVNRDIAQECVDHVSAQFWRELARLITLFDEHSPDNFLGREIGEFFCPS
jgi:hypothetical protein